MLSEPRILRFECIRVYLFDEIIIAYLQSITNLLTNELNPLQTKRRLLYLKTQSVPRCKLFSSRL